MASHLYRSLARRLAAPLLLLVSLPALAATADLQRIDAWLESGQYVQADRAIAEVLAAQPDSAPAHYLDARLLAAEGKWPLAEKELEQARRLDPGLSFAPPQQVQTLTQTILEHRWKSPSGLAGYGQGALAAGFVAISAYLIFGVLRRRRPQAKS